MLEKSLYNKLKQVFRDQAEDEFQEQILLRDHRWSAGEEDP